MSRPVTHRTIVELHQYIADCHKEINGFYRFNVAELNNDARSGVDTPTLALESHSSELEGNGISNFNTRAISFLLIDFAASDDYDKQEDLRDNLENIGLDICSYLEMINKDKNHWLYGKFDINTFRMEPVGPVFDSMYGWNVLYSIKNQEKMCFDPDNWIFPAP